MPAQIHTSPGFFNKRDIVIRHVIILLMAIFFGLLGAGEYTTELLLKKIVITFFNIALIWNGNIFLIDLFDRNLSWETHLKHKIIIAIAIAVCWPFIVHVTYGFKFFTLVNGVPCNFQNKESNIYLIISIVSALFVNCVYVAIAFFKFWRTTIKEKEEVKREIVMAEFATLKNQINPHFLFNSLNTLTNLIEEEPKLATDFVQKLSSVYRYVLTQRDKESATLKEELAFVESYVYLNKIRFGDNLITNIVVDEQHLQKHVVTLALQMLIENVIKHNIISTQRKLIIDVFVQDDYLVVKNNLQRKSVMKDSNGIGLNNIIHRYRFLAETQVDIEDNGTDFIVRLPLV